LLLPINSVILQWKRSAEIGDPFFLAAVEYGLVCGMTVRIDKSGRIVVPRVLRERFGLRPDLDLEIIEHPNGVLIRRHEEQPCMVKIDGLWVHQGTPESGARWDRVIDDLRDERAQSSFMT
jgi:AbrB family looped-hinge helix DNA binding protein